MNIKLDMYEVIEALRETGHLPEDFSLEHSHISFPKYDEKPKGKKKDKIVWTTEMLCDECSEIEFFGFLDK